MVAWGKGDHLTVERYETPAALAAAKGTSWKNAQIPGPKTLAAMAADRAAYTATAVPLPADVAEAAGFVAGAKVLGTN